MTALVLAGKNELDPAPLSTDPRTTKYTDVVRPKVEKTNIPAICRARPIEAITLAPYRSESRPENGATRPPRTYPGMSSNEASQGDIPRGPCKYIITRKITA